MRFDVETIDPHGFCSGVAGALRKALGALEGEDGTVYCLHQLVHNENVVRDFERRGMKFVETLEEVPHGAKVVFSAHGVSPSVRREAESRELRVIDATCPFVARVHRTVKSAAERGAPVVVIGNARHAEVIGVAGEAESGRVAVVRSVEDVAGVDFPVDSEVVVVSQTTLSADEVADVAEALKARFPKASFSPASEVCNATRDRQTAVRDFATRHPGEGVLVLGSSNSSNTRRLAEIAEAAGARSWRAGNMEELASIDFGDVRVLGVTSGASTPEAFLRDAVSYATAVADKYPISSLPYNAAVSDRDFKYYIFDWDDNILHMPTRIHLEHLEDDGSWRPVKVSTSLFALVRNNCRYRLPEKGGRDEAFTEFQDDPHDRGHQFLRDTACALRRIKEGEKPGPSFETLRRTLIEGRIFAIVTARGHASSTLRRAVRLFIDTVLTREERETMMRNLRGYRVWLDKATMFGSDEEELDYYLSMCRFHAVTNEDFWGQMQSDPVFGTKLQNATSAERPEMAKKFAIHDFVEHVFHMLERTGGFVRPVAIGFSDDDVGNIRAVADYVTCELSSHFPGIKFVVYDTSDANLSRGRKVVVSGQLNLPGF